MQTVVYGDQKARVLDIAYGLIEHSGEHYGQLVVYYRLAGRAAGVAAQEVKLKRPGTANSVE